MKVTLENFRCWEKKEIDVSNDSLVLLSGSSGCGKSTILNAINFAITGEGRNILTYGKSCCKVSVEIHDLIITRTRKPNRLLVKKGDKEFEDDTAQEMVNRLFGSLYSQCSYIQQDNHNTFIYMSPTDKLEFLESFAFHDIDISTKKEQIRECLRERQEEYRSATSALTSVKDIFESMTEPESVKFPLKCSPNEQPAIIEKYARLESDLSRKKSKMENDIVRHGLEKEHHGILAARQTLLLKNEEEYTKQLEKVDNTLQEFSKLEEEISECEDIISRQKLSRERNDLSKRVTTMESELQEMERNETSERQERLQVIADIIWPDENETTIREYLQNFQEFMEDMITLESTTDTPPSRKEITKTERLVKNLEQEIEELSHKYNSAVLSVKVYTCPGCHVHLRFEKNSIIRHTDEVIREDPSHIQSQLATKKTEIQRLRKSLQEQELEWKKSSDEYSRHEKTREKYEEIRSSEEVKEDISSYQSYLDTNLSLQSEKDRLEKLPESKSLREFRKKYEALRSSLARYSTPMADSEDEDVSEKYQQLLLNREEKKHLSQKQKEIRKSLSECQDEIISISNKIDGMEIGDIDFLHSELERIVEKLKKVQDTNLKINKHLSTSKLRQNWEELRHKYELITTREDIAAKRLESILLLRDKIIKAESMYLQSIIQRLSANTNSILEHFFVDNPMTIEFKSFKQVKKDTKAQINLQIWYKNNDIDLMELSGGERDRLDLAVTIALSQTFGSPLLMLDECISSLDSENFGNVLEYLRDNNAFSHVLLVSHQANEGIFDRVVEF